MTIEEFAKEYNKRVDWNLDILKQIGFNENGFSKCKSKVKEIVNDFLGLNKITKDEFDYKNAELYEYYDNGKQVFELQIFNGGLTYFWLKPDETEEEYKREKVEVIYKSVLERCKEEAELLMETKENLDELEKFAKNVCNYASDCLGSDVDNANKVEPKLKVDDKKKCKRYWDNVASITATYSSALKKQGKQKSTDNLESKFKVGDWILRNNIPCQIKSINEDGDYIVQNCNSDSMNYLSKEYCETYYRLWTIQDANDGDVLAVDNIAFIFNGSVNPLSVGAYCGITVGGDFKIFKPLGGYGYNGWTAFDNDIHPATKEQCDVLFKKMKEAGCEWDADMKKIKSNKLVTDIATSLIRFIDANREKGNMPLSNIECDDLETAVMNNNWMKVYQHMRKKLQKPYDGIAKVDDRE